MNLEKYIFYLVFLAFLGVGCNSHTTIQGEMDYAGNVHLILEEIPIHYKYASVKRDTVKISEEGSFDFSINLEEQKLAFLIIEDQQYPLVLTPGADLFITISRADFPANTQITGYSENWDQKYNSYLEAIKKIDAQISVEVEKIKNGSENQLSSLSKRKYELARENFSGTPFHSFYLKAIGEHLVYKVRSIEYNARNFDNFDADSARTELFKEADDLHFFSNESLKAQRAGIRDFAHYYARTFGIYDSVKFEFGQDLAEYDIKKLAYKELNDKRLQVLEYITDRDALAHAKMYLAAERIGEQSLEIATPSYEKYMDEFAKYTEYTEFLTYFYNEIKSVSPGEPAVAFSIPDIKEKVHTLEDYRGKFVLLDFWAGWCIPCLDEFPYMKDIYKKYSRDDLEILAISTEKDSLLWVQDIKRFNNPWPQLYGGKGFDQPTFKAYKGGGIPFYILINPDGEIARYNDIRPSFNFTSVLDSLMLKY
ncbi:MAG: TlpA disulfide reductase family protein [Balneolaceae bacterium]